MCAGKRERESSIGEMENGKIVLQLLVVLQHVCALQVLKCRC